MSGAVVEADRDAVRDVLATGLARWPMPDRIVVHAKPLPRGATGKIYRLTLRATALAIIGAD